MKVYVVQGEHPFVPGCPLIVCATRRKADEEAAALAEIMRTDTGARGPAAAPNTWKAVLRRVKAKYPDDDCWVEIVPRLVKS